MGVTLTKVGTAGVVGVLNVAADYLDGQVKVKKTVAGVVTEVPLRDQLYSSKNILGIGGFLLGLIGDPDVGRFLPSSISEPLYLSSEPLAIAAIVDIAKKLMPAASPYTPGRVGISRVEGPHWRPAGVPPRAVSPLRFT
jgi:hypothetical protein